MTKTSHQVSSAWPVAIITVIAGVLRFTALGHTSFNLDELFTVGAIRSTFGGMLHVVKVGEGTPPLFYAMAWAWAKLFGTGEVGMRVLPALLGTLTVPAMYLAARELMSQQVAVVCAFLVAINPMLIVTSQSVRAYALAILVGAVSLVFCFRALREEASKTALPALSVTASLGLVTHYYLAFLFLAEFGVLVAARVDPRRLMRAAIVPGATALVVSPLALAQASKPLYDIGSDPLIRRVAQVPKDFIVAYNMPDKVVVTVVGCSLALLALVLLATRAPVDVRQAAWIPVWLATFVLLAPLVLVPLGVDLFVTRSVSVAVLPIVILIAAGLTSGRIGQVGLVALSLVSVVPTIARVLDSRYGGLDFRGAIHEMGPPTGPRAVLLAPNPTVRGFRVYLHGARALRSGTAVKDIFVVATATEARFSTTVPHPPSLSGVVASAGFAIRSRVRSATYSIVRLSAPRPLPVDPATVIRNAGPNGLGWGIALQD